MHINHSDDFYHTVCDWSILDIVSSLIISIWQCLCTPPAPPALPRRASSLVSVMVILYYPCVVYHSSLIHTIILCINLCSVLDQFKMFSTLSCCRCTNYCIAVSSSIPEQTSDATLCLALWLACTSVLLIYLLHPLMLTEKILNSHFQIAVVLIKGVLCLALAEAHSHELHHQPCYKNQWYLYQLNTKGPWYA